MRKRRRKECLLEVDGLKDFDGMNKLQSFYKENYQ